MLLDVEEIAERECEACDYEWGLWDRIIEDSGSAIYGHVAEQMLELDEYVEMFRPHPSEISAYEWAYLRAVRHERTRRQAFQTWQANQQAKVSN